jgi:nicotinate-nucleotide adenylyltransferase
MWSSNGDRCDVSEQWPSKGRLGILGGTFDPIHVGHLIVAEEVRERLSLQRVVFVPARVSPLKLGHVAAPPECRLRMVELAIQGNPHFGVSRIDLDRQGPSYTVDTLRAIKEACGEGVELLFILGADSLSLLTAWHRPQDILRLARLVAVSRPTYKLDLNALEQDLPGISMVTDLVTTIEIGISATDIRTRVAQNLSIRYLVPAPVEAYVKEHRLYRQ